MINNKTYKRVRSRPESTPRAQATLEYILSQIRISGKGKTIDHNDALNVMTNIQPMITIVYTIFRDHCLPNARPQNVCAAMTELLYKFLANS